MLALGAFEPTAAPDLVAMAAALKAIERRGDVVLVARLDGEVVGTVEVVSFWHLQHGRGRCCELESLHVHPDYRNRGIGEALVGAAIDLAEELGCYRVQLTSNHQRPDAHRFYRRLGFTDSHLGFKRTLDTVPATRGR